VEGVVVEVVVVVGVGVVPVPRIETRIGVLVGRRPEPAHLELVVRTAQSPERVESSGIQPEIIQNHAVIFVL
jgi:hypothetical protein